MAEQYINMDNLAVGYNGKALIHDICIGIEKGEIVTLIGPNGAGKSTILKSITRQLKIISGNVKIADADLSKLSFRDLSTKMAVVLTDRMKPELMTCHDIVSTGRYPYTGKLGILSREDEQKVDEAMEAVHAQELGDRDFNAISDGQRQRVLLARAICQEPEIIVLDEPTSFLDVRYKLELLSILRNMAKKKGITVIMSLHEIDLAEKVADKIICVKGDRIDITENRKRSLRKKRSVIFMELTMDILTRSSEAWNFQDQKENQRPWSSPAVEPESRSTENCREKISHLQPGFSIPMTSTISWHAFSLYGL